jgi:hypothetical protein
MATDGLGVISDDGKTVKYSIDVQLTGTGTVLDRRCEHCNSVIVRRPALMHFADAQAAPIVIEACTGNDCPGSDNDHG